MTCVLVMLLDVLVSFVQTVCRDKFVESGYNLMQ